MSSFKDQYSSMELSLSWGRKPFVKISKSGLLQLCTCSWLIGLYICFNTHFYFVASRRLRQYEYANCVDDVRSYQHGKPQQRRILLSLLCSHSCMIVSTSLLHHTN
ncbi:uncharacterized protein LOC143434687 [Arvicanthis niloticus]|uniref:uncharacterized protein LOC143308983 n=1 Tax=Arvicanthis niloticus TaxID=61156 RepID=UPI00402BBA8A